VGIRLHCQYFYLTNFLLGVGIPSSDRSGSSTLRGKMVSIFSMFFHIAPLRIGELWGNKSTPRIVWEVLTRLSRLERRR
jgi:hypothetical protein